MNSHRKRYGRRKRNKNVRNLLCHLTDHELSVIMTDRKKRQVLKKFLNVWGSVLYAIARDELTFRREMCS